MEYFFIDELPDKPMFRCDKHRCSMQVTHCARMWTDASERGAPERLDLCRNCPIGAKHAGVGDSSTSPIRGASICARCHSGTTRLIRRHLCPSCMNRQYEWEKGKNAKGTAPVCHPPLHEISIQVVTGGAMTRFSRGKVVGVEELVFAALRDEAKQVIFSYSSIKPALQQGEMF